MNQLEASQADPNLNVPLPDGMRLASAPRNSPLQFLLGDVQSRRNRRLFGYVGEIKPSAAGRGEDPRLYVYGMAFFA